MTMKQVILIAGAFAVCLGLGQARAQERWWPVKVIDAGSGQDAIVDYEPLARASKPWNLCVLFPHMKDSFWVAVDYGVAEEARRMGVNMTLYEAGGYDNLSRQISQFDDCLASKFDAIIVGAISEAGLAQKVQEARARGVPVIGTVNPMPQSETTAKMYVAFDVMGEKTGRYLLDTLKGKPARAVTFPGPAGSGWAEQFNEGFKRALAGSPVKVLAEKFGDSGVAVQLALIQDALQAYPDMDVIWGTAPTAEAAIGAVAEVGREGKVLILSSYENQAMLDALKASSIMGFATQYPVLEGRIAIDMAVRALEKQPVMRFARPIPDMIAKSNLDRINMSLVLAPASFRPVYQSKPN